MAGFPHSNMHPAGGNEFAFVPHGGGGAFFMTEGDGDGWFDLGGMLSYAHDFGDLGMSIAGGAYWAVEQANIHGHFEFARKIQRTDALQETRYDILFGAGYSDNLEMRVPQLSVGFMHGARTDRRSAFGGCRLSAGPVFQPEIAGAQIFLSGSIGYQFWGVRVFGFSMQFVPLLGVFAVEDPAIALGAVAMFSFTFGNW